MTIELIKKTIAIYGDVYYYINVDGSMVTGTWTRDRTEAESFLDEIIKKAKKYPSDQYVTLESVTL